MSAVDLSLNYDDLLQTVKDTDRGRWFLGEFENRLRKSDSASILASIAKLENVITGMAPGGADAALVARAKAAISAARNEIASIDRDKIGLSDEGRLFAKLADMARTSFADGKTDLSPVNAGVYRALQLVDQLDQDFAGAPATLPKMEVPRLPLACFASDADVFETPAPVQSANQVASKSAIKSVTKDVERGARLVVRKLGQEEAIPAVASENLPEPQVQAVVTPIATVVAQPKIAAAPEAPPAESAAPVDDPSPQVVTPLVAAVEKKSRVVIIRRKPEDMLDVPLPEDSKNESAA